MPVLSSHDVWFSLCLSSGHNKLANIKMLRARQSAIDPPGRNHKMQSVFSNDVRRYLSCILFISGFAKLQDS